MDDQIIVARGWGDWRRLTLPRDALSGLHMATTAGGTLAPLPRPTLAAYMSCEAIPPGEEFGHSCTRGPPPHRIKVLIFKSHNAPRTYQQLEAEVREGGPELRSSRTGGP